MRAIVINGLVILTILIFAISPFISVMIAGTIADRYNCQLDEGSIHPCVVNGEDIGDTLYTLGVLGWLALATIPLGLIAIGVYLTGVATFYMARWLLRRKGKSTAEATP